MTKKIGIEDLPWIRAHDIAAWVYMFPVRYLSYLFPPRFLCRLVDRSAPVLTWFQFRQSRAIRGQIEAAYEARGSSRNAGSIASDWVRRNQRKTLDDLVMRRLDIERLSENVRIHGLEHLDNALADGKGVLVVSGHFHGNRLAKFFLRRQGYSLMSLRNRNPASVAMGRFGNRFVAPAYGRFLDGIVEDEFHIQDSGATAGIFRRLRENGLVNLHIDFAAATHATRVPFLHRATTMAHGFIRMSGLTGAPVVPMLCRGNSSGLDVRFSEPVRHEAVLSDEALGEQLERYRLVLENWVYEQPEEWELWPRLAAWEKLRSPE